MNMTMTDATAGPRNTGAFAPRTSQSSSLPAWSAVTAWGAALLELALGAGGLATEQGTVATRGVGVVLLTLGIASLGWGAATLVRGRVFAPRAGVAGSLLGIIGVTAALLTDPAQVSVVAVGAASALLIAVALACAWTMRHPSSAPASPRLSVLFGTAVIVAGIVTPALGATEAGQLAPDHSDHGIIEPGHH